MNIGKVDIVKLLGQLLEEFYPSFADKDLTYELKSNVPSQIITADGNLLARLFDNLINNAIKYGADGRRSWSAWSGSLETRKKYPQKPRLLWIFFRIGGTDRHVGLRPPRNDRKHAVTLSPRPRWGYYTLFGRNKKVLFSRSAPPGHHGDAGGIGGQLSGGHPAQTVG